MAVFLTSIIPGGGHWYAGDKRRAITLFLTGYLLIGGLSAIALKTLCYSPSLKTTTAVFAALLCMFAILAVWIWLLRDAYFAAYRINLEQGELQERDKFYKNAWFCALFSRVMPGAGQIFAGRVIRGIGFLLLYILAAKFFTGIFLSMLRIVLLSVIVRDAFKCGQVIYPSNCNIIQNYFCL